MLRGKTIRNQGLFAIFVWARPFAPVYIGGWIRWRVWIWVDLSLRLGMGLRRWVMRTILRAVVIRGRWIEVMALRRGVHLLLGVLILGLLLHDDLYQFLLVYLHLS